MVKTMSETTILNIVSHEADFDTDNEGDQFEVALIRTVDAGAPSSVATLPGQFELNPVPTTASRAADFGVTWMPSGSGDPMDWTATGDCIDTATGTVSGGDPGEVTIPANTFVQKQGAHADHVATSLIVASSATRTATSIRTTARAWTVTGTQFRSLKFSSTP